MQTFKKILAVATLLALHINVFGNEIFTTEEVSSTFDMKQIQEKPVPVSQKEPTVTNELRNQQGRVYVAFIIREDGSVCSARCFQSTNRTLDNVVLQAVKEWKFKPAKVDGNAVAVRVVVPIRVDFT